MVNLKSYLKEFAWLFFAALITLSVCTLVFGKQIFQNKIEIDLHDTYFVTQSCPILVSLFIVISFMAYIIKESKHGYERKLQNLITIGLSLLFILAVSRFIVCFSIFTFFGPVDYPYGHNAGNGWTVYPPINDPKAIDTESGLDSSQIVSYVIVVLQLIIVLLTINLSYKWGKSKHAARTDK